jgi:hypothetical protein
MRYQLSTSFSPGVDFSHEDFYRFRRMHDKMLERDSQAISRYRQRVSALRQAYLDELYRLIGSEHLPKYLKFHRRRMKNMKAALQAGEFTQDDIRRVNDVKTRNIERSASLAERSMLGAEDIDALKQKYSRLRRKAMLKLFPAEEMSNYDDLEKRDYPHITSLKPPYSVVNTQVLSDHTGDSIEPETDVHADQYGYVLGESFIRQIVADNSDDSFAYTYSWIGGECALPVTGDVLMSAKLETNDDINSHFEGKVRRECFSVTGFNLLADAYVRLAFLNVSKNRMSLKFARLTRGDQTPLPYEISYLDYFPEGVGEWEFDWWNVGVDLSSREMPMSESWETPDEAGDNVVLIAQLITVNEFHSNDFEIRSRIQHRYRIKEIRLRQV